jgi:hypothetical protein
VLLAHGKTLEPGKIGPATEARLLARNENIIATWGGVASRDLRGAALVKRPAAFGGGRLAVIGYSAADESEYSSELCAYDVQKDLERPVWRARVESHQLPEDERDASPARHDFGVYFFKVADVFPGDQFPGEELIVVFSHSRSRKAIRIYDLRGELLFSVWHNGSIGDLRWLPDARLLVCIGSDSWIQEQQIGTGDGLPYYHVVFAFSPTAHFCTNKYISSTADDPRQRPVWYRFMAPAGSQSLSYSIMFDYARPGALDPATNLKMQLSLNKVGNAMWGDDTLHPSLTFIMTTKGELVPGSVLSDDSYTGARSRFKLPPPEIFALQDDTSTNAWTSSRQ